MDGILIVDKPAGLTSHDVVARVRRILKEKRVGHTGTLDPFATGVLVLLVGRATRLAQFLGSTEKEYEGVIRFGFATETGDSTGSIRTESQSTLRSREFAKNWNEPLIAAVLVSLTGEIEQVPPMYSAKKVDGTRLYKLARQGEEIERASVMVTVRAFDAIKADGALLKHNSDGTCDLIVRVACSAGTYVRTLAESVGARLEIAAHLFALRRSRVGDFKINESQTLAELEEFVASNADLRTVLLPLRAALSGMTSTLLEDEVADRVRHGAPVRSGDRFVDGEFVQMCDATGELIAVGVYDLAEQTLRPRVVLV